MIRVKRLHYHLDWTACWVNHSDCDFYHQLEVEDRIEFSLVSLKYFRGFLIRTYSFMYVPSGWIEDD